LCYKRSNSHNNRLVSSINRVLDCKAGDLGDAGQLCCDWSLQHYSHLHCTSALTCTKVINYLRMWRQHRTCKLLDSLHRNDAVADQLCSCELKVVFCFIFPRLKLPEHHYPHYENLRLRASGEQTWVLLYCCGNN
jgi:hypothetical protein